MASVRYLLQCALSKYSNKAHCRRRFYDALEVIPKAHQKESILHLFIKQIQAIYREEGKLAGLSSEERLAQRQLVVKPLVDAFFAYLKQNETKAPKSGKTRETFTYALNQKRYLRVFLDDGDLPIDNNASERAIRGFCIVKKNWEMIDTINEATSSAIIYIYTVHLQTICMMFICDTCKACISVGVIGKHIKPCTDWKL